MSLDVKGEAWETQARWWQTEVLGHCWHFKERWAGEMVQSVRCLSLQHEDLSLIPQDPHTNLGMVVYVFAASALGK